MSPIVVLELVGVAIGTLLLLRRYASFDKIPWWATFTIYIGWMLSFAVVVLLPTDISSTFYGRCAENCGAKPITYMEKEVLMGLWKFMYWTCFLLTWLVIPLQQSYVEAGNFTVSAKLATSIKENLVFYGIVTVLLVAFMIYLMAAKHLFGSALMGFLMAGSNAWGLFILISLLGYGLVEVPRGLWHSANRELTLRHCEFRAGHLRSKLDDAEVELAQALALCKKVNEKVTVNSPLRPFVDVIVSKCPDLSSVSDAVLMEDEIEELLSNVHKEKTLAALHRRLIVAQREMEVARNRFDQVLDQAFYLEDIIRNQNNVTRKFSASMRPRRQGRFASTLESLEWYWRVHLECPLRRVLAVACALMSIAVVWSECVMMSVDVDGKTVLSIFAAIIRIPMHDFGRQLATVIPVAYICYVTYSSLFKVQIFSYYSLVPSRLSSANSLLFAAAYLSRLAPPLCYNFLMLIHEANRQDSAFAQVMGDMTVLPFFGSRFNDYFPLFLFFLCAGTFFNVYSKILNACDVKRFVFEDDFSTEQIAEGRTLIDRERSIRERGIVRSSSSVRSPPDIPSSRLSKPEPVVPGVRLTGKDPAGFPALMGRRRDPFLDDDDEEVSGGRTGTSLASSLINPERPKDAERARARNLPFDQL